MGHGRRGRHGVAFDILDSIEFALVRSVRVLILFYQSRSYWCIVRSGDGLLFKINLNHVPVYQPSPEKVKIMSSENFQGKHSEITDLILNAFYKVHRKMGYGFNEKVYENSLAIELRKSGLVAMQQQEIEVFYEQESVGTYFADIVVNNLVIVELKAAKQIASEHEAQLLNYLKATRIEVGLLLNFGPKAAMKRRVYDNELKGSMEWLDRIDTE